MTVVDYDKVEEGTLGVVVVGGGGLGDGLSGSANSVGTLVNYASNSKTFNFTYNPSLLSLRL